MESNVDSCDNDGKHRKRMKKLLNSIQEQLDFFFGNANLHHDRFMRKEIEENEGGFISLETLLKFNSLKKIVSEKPLLVKAIENSPKLQLNEDKTKVKRIAPLPPLNQNEVDSRTVYVDQLHGYCDHTWIKQVFSTCGKVEYISLPRYKHDNSIKGFAFVEFSIKEEAEKACRILNTAEGGKSKGRKKQSLDKDTTADPSTTATPTKSRRRRSVSVSESEIENKPSLKRKRSASECSDGSPSKMKRKRKASMEERSLSEIKDKVLHVTDKRNEKPPENKHANETLDQNKTTGTTDTKDDGDENKDLKKKSKKNRKHKQKDKHQKEILVAPMYVISKKEWTTLKNKYKKLQADEYRKLKHNIRIIKSERVRRKEIKMIFNEEHLVDDKKVTKSNITKDVRSSELKIKDGIKETDSKNKESRDEKERHSNKSSTDAGKMENKASDSKQVLNEDAKENKLTVNKEKCMKKQDLVPGTVARITTTDDKLTKDIIRKTLSSIADVAYVDFLTGAQKGYVRFKSVGMRNIAMGTSDEMKESWNFKIDKLKEDDETVYLQKALEDQQKRYQLNAKKKKKREERGMVKV